MGQLGLNRSKWLHRGPKKGSQIGFQNYHELNWMAFKPRSPGSSSVLWLTCSFYWYGKKKFFFLSKNWPLSWFVVLSSDGCIFMCVPLPRNFPCIGPLGRFSLSIAMSVSRTSVCLCVQSQKLSKIPPPPPCVSCHVSHVTCQVSHVRCQVSGVNFCCGQSVGASRCVCVLIPSPVREGSTFLVITGV